MAGMHPFGWLFQLLILVVFFLVVFWILKGMKKEESPIEILKRRYAQGEIAKKEYDELKKELA